MNDNLISEIIDLNKVKANLAELQKMWEQLIANMAAKSGKDLKFDNLAQNLKTVTTAENELLKAKQAGLEVDGKKAKITAEIIANYDKYSKEEQKIIENEIKRKAEVSETNKTLKDRFTNEQNLVKVLQRETKSIADLDKQNKDLQRIQQKLNITTKEGQDANAKINAQIEKNKQTTKEYTNVLDAQKRNIGNYQGAVDTVNMSLGEMKKELMALRNVSFANLKPEEITQIRDRMAELTDAVGDFQSQIKTAAADRIPALMDGLQGLVAVAQGVTGTLAIFGVETEKLDKAMVQLIGVSQALKTIQELQEKGTIRVMWATVKDTAAKTANAVAAKGQAMATTGATAATRALGKAMMSNPYLVMAAAAAALISGTIVLIKYLKEQGSIQNEINEANEAAAKDIGTQKQDLNSLLNIAKDHSKSLRERQDAMDEINKLSPEYLGNLTLETINTKSAASAINLYTQEISKKAKAKALESILTEKYIKLEELYAAGAQIRKISDTKDEIAALERKLADLTTTTAIFSNVTAGAQSNFTDLIGTSQFGVPEGTKTINYDGTPIEYKGGKWVAVVVNPPDNTAAKNAYKSYTEAIAKANEEYQIMIQFLKSDADLKQAAIDRDQKLFDANLNYYKKVTPEMQKMIDVYKIDDIPQKIEKNLIKPIQRANEVTIEMSETMRDVVPDELPKIFDKLKSVFNDFFGTKPIEDWRDTFVESMKQVIDESIQLFNTIVEMQQNQLEQELDHINTLYDSQMSALESTYDRRKKLLEATIDDEEELAAALARIEEEKAAVQGKFQDEKFKKEQEIAQKQAILAKKKAAMEVATGSATALVEAIKLIGIATTTAAPGDPYSLVARIAAALAAALTVVGAVTAGIAKVKAIEIPQFWAGGEAREGQLISVAERGKELAVGESGKSYMFDKQSVIVAPEKMRIFSNTETKQIEKNQTINNTYEKQSNVNLTVNIDNERHKKYFKLT